MLVSSCKQNNEDYLIKGEPTSKDWGSRTINQTRFWEAFHKANDSGKELKNKLFGIRMHCIEDNRKLRKEGLPFLTFDQLETKIKREITKQLSWKETYHFHRIYRKYTKLVKEKNEAKQR